MENKKLWFKAKMYGWGWTPISWEGWIITILYLIAIIQFGLEADRWAHSGSDALISFAIPFIVTTIFLLVICYARGERPGWRWSGKNLK